MFCIKCGNKVGEEAQFCSKCGTSQARITPVVKESLGKEGTFTEVKDKQENQLSNVEMSEIQVEKVDNEEKSETFINAELIVESIMQEIERIKQTLKNNNSLEDWYKNDHVNNFTEDELEEELSYLVIYVYTNHLSEKLTDKQILQIWDNTDESEKTYDAYSKILKSNESSAQTKEKTILVDKNKIMSKEISTQIEAKEQKEVKPTKVITGLEGLTLQAIVVATVLTGDEMFHIWYLIDGGYSISFLIGTEVFWAFVIKWALLFIAIKIFGNLLKKLNKKIWGN